MTPRHLIVFARAPRYGTVKSRLAAGIGALGALRFHRAELARLLREVGHDARWTTCIAATPDGVAGPWTQGLPVMPQGQGSLGQRMLRALEAVPSGPAVLVGCDIPGLRARHIARAFDALRTADAVFGPAVDGGFWLVGLSHRRPLPDPFANARWSTAHALDDCLANLRHSRTSLVDTLSDVDDALPDGR